jgi:hypothetical protein
MIKPSNKRTLFERRVDEIPNTSFHSATLEVIDIAETVVIWMHEQGVALDPIALAQLTRTIVEQANRKDDLWKSL